VVSKGGREKEEIRGGCLGLGGRWVQIGKVAPEREKIYVTKERSKKNNNGREEG